MSTTDSESRPKHRRARRACLSCRTRKVRCDIVEHDPCSNCRWDKVQCVVPRSRRNRKFIQPFHPPEIHGQNSRAIYFEPGSIIPEEALPPQPSSVGAANEESQISLNQEGLPLPVWPPDGGLQSLFQNDSPNHQPAQTLDNAPLPFDMDTDTATKLPPYINVARFVVDSTRTTILKIQGAFELPPIAVQHALILAYLEFAYPRMPLLDMDDFYRSLSQLDGSGGQISLLLLQCVLFAGCAHVSPRALREGGYNDKKRLRQDLYHRAEALFESNLESDRITLIQAALLLTSRGVSQAEHKDSWHWLNVAASLAYSIGLHFSDQTDQMPPKQVRFRRRLWWCCYVRDKILAFGLRRPTRIKDEDCHVSMLEIHDLEGFLPREPYFILGLSVIQPCSHAQHIKSAELCIEKTKLSVLLGRVLQLDGRTPGDSGTRLGTTNCPGRDLSQEFDSVNDELRTWHEQLPESCRYRPLDHRFSPFHVRRQLMHMTYNAAMYVLHRPRFLPKSPGQVPTAVSEEAQAASRKLVSRSATNITRLAAELHECNQDTDLPLTAIVILCPAIFINILNMKSSNYTVSTLALFSFRVCMRVMERLQQLYSATELTIRYLETVLRAGSTGGIRIPSMAEVIQMNKLDRNDVLMVLYTATTPPRPIHSITDYSETLVHGDIGALEEQWNDEDPVTDTDVPWLLDSPEPCETRAAATTLESLESPLFTSNILDMGAARSTDGWSDLAPGSVWSPDWLQSF